MTDIVNLRNVRKQRARAEAEIKAAENRVRFGVSKKAKAAAGAAEAASKRRLEAHRRENGGDAADE